MCCENDKFVNEIAMQKFWKEAAISIDELLIRQENVIVN